MQVKTPPPGRAGLLACPLDFCPVLDAPYMETWACPDLVSWRCEVNGDSTQA